MDQTVDRDQLKVIRKYAPRLRGFVERGFNQLKQRRGTASRTDRHAINCRGAITFRATLAWIA